MTLFKQNVTLIKYVFKLKAVESGKQEKSASADLIRSFLNVPL